MRDALKKEAKTTLILAAVAVAAYLGYRWYMNKQAANQGSGSLGSNLNSVAPALIGGSTGPTSGLTYYAGATNVFTAAPISTPATTATPSTPAAPSDNLPTPVLAYGQSITTISGLKAALANAANPFKAKQANKSG